MAEVNEDGYRFPKTGEQINQILDDAQNDHQKVSDLELNSLQTEDSNDGDVSLRDEDGNILVMFANGHIYTKNFDSSKSNQGGSSVVVDDSLSETSANPVSNAAITNELKKKIESGSFATINGQRITNGGNITVEPIAIPSEGFGKSFKILFVGNSFTQDALSCVPQIVRDVLGSADITISMFVVAGQSLLGFYESGFGYRSTYYKSVNGNQFSTSTKSLGEAIADEEWDYISFQQVSGESSNYSTYQPYLNALLAQVYEISPRSVKFAFMLTTPKVNGGVSTFNGQAEAANNVLKDSIAESIIPAGTALENLRTIAYFNDYGEERYMMKNSHLQTGIGMFVEGLAVVQWIANKADIKKSVYGCSVNPSSSVYYNSIRGSIVGVDEQNIRLAQIAAVSANNNPISITDMGKTYEFFKWSNLEVLYRSDNGYYKGEVGNYVTAELNSSFKRSIKYPCNNGDIFVVNGKGGNVALLWAFLDEDYKVIQRAEQYAEETNAEHIAPTNAKFFVFSSSTSVPYSYSKK